jgi:transcriptional regulator GlxA family with amidase domain
VAAQAARLSVMPLERLGGQAQFIAGPADTAAPTGAGTSLQPLLEWVARHLDEELTLADLAAVANLSTPRVSQFLLIKSRRRPRLRERSEFPAG